MGYGIIGVSWVTIGTQGLVTLILFSKIRQYICQDTKEFVGLMKRVFFPFVISLLLYLVSIFFESQIHSIFIYSDLSLLFFVFVWINILHFFYQDYFPKEKIVNIWAVCTASFKNKLGNIR